MGSINCMVASGHLTKDPELRTTQNKIPVCRFTLAINDVEGADRTPAPTFIHVSCFNRQAESVHAHLKKGAFVEVMGRLRMAEWTHAGQTYNRHEIEAKVVNFGPMSWTAA